MFQRNEKPITNLRLRYPCCWSLEGRTLNVFDGLQLTDIPFLSGEAWRKGVIAKSELISVSVENHT